jgi:hypothetical protein
MKPIVPILGSAFMPAVLGSCTLAAFVGAAALIAVDVMSAPLRPAPARREAVPAAPTPEPPVPDRSVRTVEKIALAGGEKTDVTLFRRVAVKLGTHEYDVVSGIVYDRASSPDIRRSFCYVERNGPSENMRVTVALARREGGVTIPATVVEKDATAMGVALKDLQDASAGCRLE